MMRDLRILMKPLSSFLLYNNNNQNERIELNEQGLLIY